MRTDLSSFLQWKFNVFMYQLVGWRLTFFYILTLGYLYFFLKKEERNKIKASVDALFSDRKNRDQRDEITRRVFRGILLHYYEKIFNAYADNSELMRFFNESIEADSLGLLDCALKKGKGVLFVTGHYGGIEYIPIFLAIKGYPISVIARFSTRQLKHTLYSKTKDLGLRIIDTRQKKRVLDVIFRELRSNRIVFFECDEIEQWKPSAKEKMHFLGRIIGVDKTLTLIQKRTGAEVVFGLLHRFSIKKYTLIMESYEDIWLKLNKIDASVGMNILTFLEEYIYSYPEEWYQWGNLGRIKVRHTPAVKTTRPKAPLFIQRAT